MLSIEIYRWPISDRNGRRRSWSRCGSGLPRGGARRVRRDADLHGIPARTLAPDQYENGIDRINRRIRRKTRIAGTFPNGNSALMLVTARLKNIVEHEWGKRRYLDMSKPEEIDELKGKAESQKRTGPRTAKSICERILSIPFRPRRISLQCYFF